MTMRARTTATRPRAGDPLGHPDYLDAFEIDRPPGDLRLPEAWARAIFEDQPAVLRLFLLAGWRGVLLLRLRPGDPGRVLGWRVIDRRPAEVTIEAPGPLLTSHLVFDVEEHRVRVATYLRYHRRGVVALWAPVGLLHRRIIPFLLRRAGARAVTTAHPG